MTFAYIGVGSNVEPVLHVTRAVAHFAASGELRRVSTFRRTRAVGGGPDFANGVIAIEPDAIGPALLRRRLLALEARLGRVRTEEKNAPRTIDLDLLAWDGHEAGRLPHPDVARYPFVALALAEVAPQHRLLVQEGPAAAAYDPLRRLTIALRSLATARNVIP